MRTELRKDLPELPLRLKKLPIDPRGYPIPWFVMTMEDGSRDFRIADQVKRVRAVKERLCWVCGEPLGRFVAFIIGPMCAINRNTSEPGSHLECAQFSVRACPFLTRPKAQPRRANMPEGSKEIVGSLPGNPGACAIWITRDFSPYPAGEGEWLIRLGEPSEVQWFAEGKTATREQIMASINERIHFLEEAAAQDGPGGRAELQKYIDRAMRYLPA